jgi:hypothetical protein
VGGSKTGAFAFGIVVIELLTSLDGAGARTLVEIGEKPLVEELASHPRAPSASAG